MGSKLYVGNLSYNSTSSDLEQLFGRSTAPSQSAEVIQDRDTGRSKGFGFVEMGSDEGGPSGHRRPQRPGSRTAAPSPSTKPSPAKIAAAAAAVVAAATAAAAVAARGGGGYGGGGGGGGGREPLLSQCDN